MCFAALLCSNFANSRMEVPRYRSSFSSWDHFFSQCISSREVLGKTTSIRSKLPTAACWSRQEKRGNWEANLLYVESAFGTTAGYHRHHRQIIHSILSLKALNLIASDSKSQPIELDYSTIELHVPSRRKKSLQSYCSVDFGFLALMRFDMTLDVTLRDDSSFGKLTNLCN